MLGARQRETVSNEHTAEAGRSETAAILWHTWRRCHAEEWERLRGEADVLGLGAERRLHGQGRITGPHCMVCRRQRRATEGHNAIRGAVSLERLAQDANGELVYTFTHPWSDGTTGIRLSPLELLEKLAALVPLPRMHLVRYGGCLAPHSHLRGAIIPTPRQQGMEDEEATDTGSPRWSWARLLKRVFALDMARCPFCQQGSLRIIAAITHGEVIRKILQHLKLSADPPPIAAACVRQAAFAWSSA